MTSTPFLTFYLIFSIRLQFSSLQPYFTVVFSLSVSTSIKAFSFCSQDIISCVWVGILPSLHGSWWVLLYSQEWVPGQMWVFAWGLSHLLLPQSLKTWPLCADVSSDLRSTFSAPFTSSNELDNVPDLFNLNSIPCRCFPCRVGFCLSGRRWHRVSLRCWRA